MKVKLMRWSEIPTAAEGDRIDCRSCWSAYWLFSIPIPCPLFIILFSINILLQGAASFCKQAQSWLYTFIRQGLRSYTVGPLLLSIAGVFRPSYLSISYKRAIILSYGPLNTSEVAGRQLHGSVSTGNTLDSAHCGRQEVTPTVP